MSLLTTHSDSPLSSVSVDSGSPLSYICMLPVYSGSPLSYVSVDSGSQLSYVSVDNMQ